MPLWVPRRVLMTPGARHWEHGNAIARRAAALGSDIVEMRSDRLTGLSDSDPRKQYVGAKTSLAVVVASPSKRRPQPIPPSADWQFHLAEGCPAHCQYCYLAGSLKGPPVTRVYANLPEILDSLPAYQGKGAVTSKLKARAGEGTTFECSCYTDPLGIEHLTGSLARSIEFFGNWNAPVQLRWTTKFDAVDALLSIAHRGRTRARFSVNAASVVRGTEGGTANTACRLAAIAKMARAGYPVGLTIAPIMRVDNWREEYEQLLRGVAAALAGIAPLDLTAELITHRFTPGSKLVLLEWYPKTKLDLDEAKRQEKRTKFGSLKYVYPADQMRELRTWFEAKLAEHLPAAKILYWT
jgi:spore photoproduct lyase